MGHAIHEGEAYARTREIAAAGDAGITPPESATRTAELVEFPPEAVTGIHTFIAIDHAYHDGIVFHGEREALLAGAEFLERADDEELRLLGRILRAFEAQGSGAGVRPSDNAKLRSLFLEVGHQELAKVDPKSVL